MARSSQQQQGKGIKKSPQKKSTSTNKRGRKGKSKGEAGKKKQPAKKMTQEELDRQMDDYMMKDPKMANKKLDDDMDSYWEQKKLKDAEAAGAEA